MVFGWFVAVIYANALLILVWFLSVSILFSLWLSETLVLLVSGSYIWLESLSLISDNLKVPTLLMTFVFPDKVQASTDISPYNSGRESTAWGVFLMIGYLGYIIYVRCLSLVHALLFASFIINSL